MIAIYTETLQQYIDNGNDVHQEIFNLFPSFSLIDGFSFTFYQLFLDKYKTREIGCESEQLFDIFLKRKLERVALEYIPKVNKYIATFNNLFERKIVLTTQISKDGNDSESESNEIAYTGTDTNTTSITNDSSNSENTYYLNPVTSATQNLKVDNVESTSVSRTYNDSNQLTRNTTDTESKNRIKTNNELITENRDTLLNLLGKTNTSLLEEIMNLKNIYLTALDEFEDIFMTIY